MQGEELKKKVARNDYLNLYKDQVNAEAKEKPDDFTQAAEKETAKKTKKQRGAKFRGKEDVD